LVAANQRDTHASIECGATCAKLLLEIQRDHLLLEDTADQVWSEYRRYNKPVGQPGVGDRFFRWYMLNRYSEGSVVRVDVGSNASEVSANIPLALQTFDPSDHKWIALFILGPGDVIYNAMDSDYVESAAELTREEISVVELC
jgi:hypothetical protein